MTQKEKKQLLLLELCSRLPYGVKGLHRGKVHELFTIDCREVNNACIQVDEYNAWFSIDTFKPYLRPMSSMTKKEKKQFNNFICIDYDAFFEKENGHINQAKIMSDGIDWLLKHHFDFRGLIPMKLALEAPEGFYKTN